MSNHTAVIKGVQIALAILGLLIALWLLMQLQYIVVLLLISLILAAGIHPIVEWIQHSLKTQIGWDSPRWLAISIALLFIIIIALAVIYYAGYALWKQGGDVLNDSPSYLQSVSGWLARLREEFPQIPSDQDLIKSAQDEVIRLRSYLWQTTSAVLGVFDGVGAALTVLVLSFYMLLEREALHANFLSFVPPAQQSRIDNATNEALHTMGSCIRGQAILVLAMAALVSLAMALLGVPRPVLLGIISGICEFIPLIGPIIAACIIMPVIIFSMPLWVTVVSLIFFIILSNVEAHIIVPQVMKKNVKLSPLATVVALMCGISLYGILGAVLAIPLAAALRVILQRLVVPAIQGESVGPKLVIPNSGPGSP